MFILARGLTPQLRGPGLRCVRGHIWRLLRLQSRGSHPVLGLTLQQPVNWTARSKTFKIGGAKSRGRLFSAARITHVIGITCMTKTWKWRSNYGISYPSLRTYRNKFKKWTLESFPNLCISTASTTSAGTCMVTKQT